MEWHVERRGVFSACYYHPCQVIVAAVRLGLGGVKLVVSTFIDGVWAVLRAAYAVGSATAAACEDLKRQFLADEFTLLCSHNAGGPVAACVPALHLCAQGGERDHATPAPVPKPEKPLCGESHLQLAIPSCLDNITFVGAVVNAACLTLSFSAQEATQIELCVVEAVVNAIKHAYAGRPGHVVEVRVATQVDRLVLQVCDYGQAMVGDIPTTLDFDPNDLTQVPEGGMGLFLMHSLMDEVSYQSNQGTNILTMTKRLSA